MNVSLSQPPDLSHAGGRISRECLGRRGIRPKNRDPEAGFRDSLCPVPSTVATLNGAAAASTAADVPQGEIMTVMTKDAQEFARQVERMEAATHRADAVHARNVAANPAKRRPARLPTQVGQFAATPVELLRMPINATATTATGKGVTSSYTPTAPAPTGPLSEADAKARAAAEWDAGRATYPSRSKECYVAWRTLELRGLAQHTGGAVQSITFTDPRYQR